MMATMPFSFKVFWAPIVELYHLPFMGKRKSWIVPMQMVMCMILFYLQGTIIDMLKAKDVYKLAYLLIANTFVITC